MEQRISKKILIDRLQKEILLLEGFKPADTGSVRIKGLDVIENAFPNAVFPTGTLHEFINEDAEHAAAAGGFIAGLLNALMPAEGNCLWISTNRKLFPPALKAFGIEPDRIIFIDLQREKDVLWATEEALRCTGLTAVIAEVRQLNFAQSRRLQLVMEKSKVTGFVLVRDQARLGSTACTARWKISPAVSELEDGMPGVGFPRWNVELLKARNGNPGKWMFEWTVNGFKQVHRTEQELYQQDDNRKAG